MNSASRGEEFRQYGHLCVNRAAIVADRRFVALSRHNTSAEGLKLNNMPHWTQDVWAVARNSEPIPSALIQEAGFELGHPGCDNKIAYVMHSYG